MEITLLAPCGLDCAKCEAYIATQSNDLSAQQALLARWQIEYNSPEMTLADVTCDGCTTGQRHGGYCGACPVRSCAGSHGFATCAECGDYSCAELDKLLAYSPANRTVLDALRPSQPH